MGPPIDAMLPELDVVHVAGLATPPTKRVPLIVSVDDLRPLRGESRTHLRLAQLRRVVERGAIIVASSCSASHEVQSVLGVPRSQVVVVPPAVPNVEPTRGGTDLVVNVTGLAELFLLVAPALVLFARSRSTRVVALTSHEVGQQIHAAGMAVTVQPRHEARRALANARVVMHLSDGARFPSFAIAALSAGVPTIARSTEINRELLGGAAQLVGTYAEVPETLDELWESESRRAIMIAAGRSRAVDFAPSTAARAYASLYREAVRGWTP